MVIVGVSLAAGVSTAQGESVPPGEDSSSRVEVFIGFKGRPGHKEKELVRAEGGRVDHAYRVVDSVAAHVPEESLDDIRRNGRVRYVERVPRVFAVDHGIELDSTWGVTRVGAGDVHHVPYTGEAVRVGVLDTGIDTDHPDLTYDPKCSYNFVRNTAVPEDGHGHGTHVAGTIAALRNLSGVVGGAPSATLCVYKVLDDSGSGSFSNVVAAIDRAIADGVRITNNSYGSSGDPGTTARAAFDGAYAAGILNVAAAGNSGRSDGTGTNCVYPARYASAVATAATTSSDTRASFSSTCPEVELAAPGVLVRSTTRGGGYGVMSGTSTATPHVAGVAALIQSANPGWDASQLRQRLQSTAQDLGIAERDTHFGFGLVKADAAVGASVLAKGALQGVVVNAASGAPVAGATVTVTGAAPATTGADGSYSIADVAAGSRLVTASAGGYQTQTKTAAVNGDATSVVDFALAPPPTVPSVRVASLTYTTEGGTASNKHLKVTLALLNHENKPVSGASVRIHILRGGTKVYSRQGTTSSDGRVSITYKSAPAGCYSTTVTSVAASGLKWDGRTPSNSFCK